MFAHVDKTLRYYYSLQELCKSKKIPLKQVQMLHIYHGWWYNPATQKQDAVEMDNSRFLQHINNNNLFNHDDKILLAISGGADSVCLALLLLDCGFNFVMAHCNFKLRGIDSDKDEDFV